MSEQPRVLTVEEALSLLPDGDRIRTFRDADGVPVGATFSVFLVEHLIRVASHRAVAGRMARGLGHGLVIVSKRDPDEDDKTFFVETDMAKLDALDPPVGKPPFPI